MDNSLLAVRGINHKYIVVDCVYSEGRQKRYDHLYGQQCKEREKEPC